MAAALPFIMLAGGAAQGISQKNAADTNATIQGFEGRTAAAQGYSAEATQRRQGQTAISREEASAGQAGGGYQGSAGRSIGQSATNAEMDNLNIRYKAGLQKWGYLTQSSFTKQEGNDALATSSIRAGSALLKGFSGSYTGEDLS